jgi:hypothetical protein
MISGPIPSLSIPKEQRFPSLDNILRLCLLFSLQLLNSASTSITLRMIPIISTSKTKLSNALMNFWSKKTPLGQSRTH